MARLRRRPRRHEILRAHRHQSEQRWAVEARLGVGHRCSAQARAAYASGQVPNGTGFVHRGVATWADGRDRRIFMNSRWNLIALDAATGKLVRAFGDTGVVDLTARLARDGKPVNKLHYTQTSPPAVWR